MESNRGLQGDMIAPIPGYGGTQSVETGAPMLHSTTAVMTGTRANAVPVLVPRRAWVVDQIPIGGAPHRPLFTPNGQSGLVINQHLDELEILDPVSDTIIDTVLVGTAPHGLATSADGRIAYVTNEGSNDVSVVDRISRRVTATIPVGHGPRQIVVQPGPAAPPLTTALAPGGVPMRLTATTQSMKGLHSWGSPRPAPLVAREEDIRR